MYIFIILLNENTVTTSRPAHRDGFVNRTARGTVVEKIAVHQIVKLSNITWIRHTLNEKRKNIVSDRFEAERKKRCSFLAHLRVLCTYIVV